MARRSTFVDRLVGVDVNINAVTGIDLRLKTCDSGTHICFFILFV